MHLTNYLKDQKKKIFFFPNKEKKKNISLSLYFALLTLFIIKSVYLPFVCVCVLGDGVKMQFDLISVRSGVNFKFFLYILNWIQIVFCRCVLPIGTSALAWFCCLWFCSILIEKRKRESPHSQRDLIHIHTNNFSRLNFKKWTESDMGKEGDGGMKTKQPQL